MYISAGSFIPLRVTDKTILIGMDDNYRQGSMRVNVFDGHIRWLLHSPGVTRNPIRFAMREEKGHGIIASYW